MEISKFETIKEAFLIDSIDLNSFDNLLNDLPGETTYSVETADKINRKYESMDTILSHENSSKNPIQKIIIYKHSIDPNLTLVTSFNKNSGVSYYFSTKQESLIPKFNRFIDTVEGTKAWYSPLSKHHYTSSSIFLVGLSMLIVGILGSYGLILESNEWIASLTKADINLMLFLFLALGILIGYIIDKLKSKIFPNGFFAIGQGKKRHRELIFFQASILTIFVAILGLIIGVALQ